MFNLWIGNLGKYNEGELVGEWIQLPYTEEELRKLYARIQVGYFNENGDYIHGLEEDGSFYEEIFIADYETDLSITIEQYSNLDSLNELASLTELSQGSDRDAIKALLEVSDSWEVAIQIYNSGDFWYQEGLRDTDDLGVYVVQEGLFGCEIPDSLMNYIDYKAIGRDWEMNGNFTSEGFVYLYK